ncbi:uncharacterized protein LOC106668655 [Cimex lectularius]|uniref:Uncharacterized protein n=1 Tax=Cimex lectularius TaxID=79782 RepID=A0A8I6S029_CIMLE|nr:uncharacterized protein LOC106668655 [Cimex lectularius]XP_014253094.1 uncharacterized protein LOC106668655 [Cimex lectularius]XP_014253095.1 uncharacterized protein LOC106668655 [Cimex lectularius]
MGEKGGRCDIYVGKRFRSFEEVSEFIKAYEAEKKQKFWIRSSRSVEAVRKILRRPLNKKIKYYELQYSCVHGGIEFKTRSKGLRRKGTYKIDCPAKIKIRATMDGNQLEIKSFIDDHQGHLEQEAGRWCKKPRYRVGVSASEVKKVKSVGESKDSDSMTESDEDTDFLSKSKIHPLLESLKLAIDAHGSTLYDNDEHLIGIYLTTKAMEKSLNAWHDVIYIWTIQGWLKQNFSVILATIKDSNGDFEIISVGLVEEEDKLSFSWFFKTFKENIDNHNLKIKYIFGEKHLVETHLKQLFPHTITFVSLYYSLKLFERILDTESFLTPKKEHCMNYFCKMAYSRSLEDYKGVYSSFCKSAPQGMVDYFDEDWGSNIQDWTFFNMTNGTLVDDSKTSEAVDARVKEIIQKNTPLLSFIEQLFKWINIQKVEFKFKASTYVLKKPSSLNLRGSCLDKYSQLLTNYAFDYVSHQINLSKNVNILETVEDNLYITQENMVLYPSSVNSCECRDWRSMMLPCKHIFAVRKACKENFFCADLCNVRWTKSYYIENRLEVEEVEKLIKDKLVTSDVTTEDSEYDKLSENTRRAITITDKILNILSRQAGNELEEKIQVLEEIGNLWSDGQNVKVTAFSAGSPEKDVSPPEVLQTKKVQKVVKTIPVSTNSNEELQKVKLLKHPQMTSKIIKIDLSHYGKVNVPLKFSLKPKAEKIRMMIDWIVKKGENQSYGENDVLDVADIESDPKLIQHSILNETVDLELIKPRLSPDAFQLLLTVVNAKRENEIWLCFICEAQLEDSCVLCASCLLWFHSKCVGIANPQKRKVWFCYNCLKSCDEKK